MQGKTKGIVGEGNVWYTTVWDDFSRLFSIPVRHDKDGSRMTNLSPRDVALLAARFAPGGIAEAPRPFGGGHINDTYRFTPAGDTPCVLQRINRNAFPHPDEVMDNMYRVTEHLRARIARAGGDPARETLCLLKTVDGALFATDPCGDVWRCYRFVDRSISYEHTADPDVFRETGRAFGRFLCMLEDFDAATLHETIVRFHDMPGRFRDFHRAVENNLAGRANRVRDLIDRLMPYEPFAQTLAVALQNGELPLRVTHNDAKMANVLVDEQTRRALCVIDLDTVMPGLCANDFGDAIRTGASTAAEDERDLSRVSLSLPMYRAFAEGYLGEAADRLSENELRSLPVGAKMMTLETAIRFLGDYLNGDIYYKTAYPEHNLVRAKTQLTLLTDMDAHWDEMLRIVLELGHRKG